MAEQFVPMQTASGELFVPQHIASANKPLEVANAQNLSASIKDFNQNLSPDMRFGSFRNESSEQARIDQQNETKEHQLESLRNSLSDASVAQKLHEQSSLLESTLPKVGRRPSQAPSLAGGHHTEQMGINPNDVPKSLKKDIAKVARSGEKLSDTPLLQPNSAKQLNRTPAPAFDIASIQEPPVPEQAQTPSPDIYDPWSDLEHLHPEDGSKPKPLDARDIEEMFSDVNIPNNDENVAPTSNGLVDVWSDVDSALPQDDESELVGTNALPGLHPDSNWHAEDDNEQREITHDEQADVHSPEEPSSEIPLATASQLPDILPADSDWFDDTAHLSEAGMNPDAPTRRQIPEHLLKRSQEARLRHKQALLSEDTRQTDVVASAPNPTDTNNPADTEINADEPSLGDSILSIWKKFIDSHKDMKVLEENKGELFDLTSITVSQALSGENPFPDLDRDKILSVFDVLRPYLLSIFTDVVTDATGQQTVLSLNEGSVKNIFDRIMSLNKEKFPELDDQIPVEDDTIPGEFDDAFDDEDVTPLETIRTAGDPLVVTFDDDDTIDGDFDDEDVTPLETIRPAGDPLVVTFDDEVDMRPLDVQFSIEEDGITDEAMLNFVNSYPKPETRARLRGMTKENLIEFYDMVHSKNQPTFVRLGEVAADRVVSGAKGALRRARQVVEETRQSALDTRTATQESSNEQRSRLPKINREALLARIPPEARASFSTFSDELLRDAVTSLEESLRSGTTLSRIPRSAAEVKGAARRTTSAVARAAVNTRQRNLEQRR